MRLRIVDNQVRIAEVEDAAQRFHFAVTGQEGGSHSLSDFESLDVIGDKTIEKLNRFASVDLDRTAVGNVNQASVRTHGKMLLSGVRIELGHLPAVRQTKHRPRLSLRLIKRRPSNLFGRFVHYPSVLIRNE